MGEHERAFWCIIRMWDKDSQLVVERFSEANSKEEHEGVLWCITITWDGGVQRW
jgi:hypothetical protein